MILLNSPVRNRSVKSFKIIFLFSSLFLFQFLTKAQTPCNLIGNPTFVSGAAAPWSVNPFQLFWVPFWRESSLTPQIISPGTTDAFAANMWSLNNGKNVFGEGIITTNPLGLIVGREYIFSMMAKNSTNPVTVPIPTARVDFSNYLPNFSAVPFVDPMLGTQSIINRTNLVNSAFAQFQACVTPSQAWTNVYIHPYTNSTTFTAWLTVDDIELIPNFDFAGPDRKKCLPNAVTIGGNCTPINVVFTYNWQVLGSSTSIGTTQQISVNPSSTTQYVCVRTPVGLPCTARDTVTVEVTTPPYKLSLGPDTSLCAGQVWSLYMFPWNTYYNLYLNGVYSPGDYIYITKSGQYILRNVDPATGCENADTINITFHPELPHRDTILYYCSKTFPKTICTYPGFSRYKWTSPPAGANDTLKCITVSAFGKYTVKITDSFGCETYDTFNIKEKKPPYTNLPNDTLLCPGTSLTLNGGPGMLHYLWSTGDTTSSIIVTTTGKYILSVYTQDSCFGQDSITVTFMNRPSFTLLSKSVFCIYDDCDTIKISPSWTHDTIMVDSVLKKIFCPSVEGCGEHIINYHYTDSAGCTYDTTFKFIVVCPDTPDIDSVGYLCLTDTPVVLSATPAGGTFSGAGVSAGVFYPGTAGVGWHWVKYCYTDSIYGCTTCDSIKIKVVGITAQIIPLTDTSRLCDHKPVKLKARGGNTFYWLHNASTDSIITVTEAGTYCVVVSDDTAGCPDTACITLIYKNCCDLFYTEPFTDPDGEVFIYDDGPYNYLHDTLMVITGTVRVMPGATWTIENSKIILKDCARIIIERGVAGGGGIPAGKMYVYNSNLIGCQWKGIEVWGAYDDCNADTAGQTNGGSSLQGKLIMYNDTISDADMAIFVGRRDEPSLLGVPWQQYSGGVIDIQNCVFKHNYADIVFSEYSVIDVACNRGANTCASLFGFYLPLVSKVENNIFDTLKSTEDCDLFLNTQLGIYLSNPWYCHIINFSDNPIFTRGPGVGGPPLIYEPTCNNLNLFPGSFICSDDIRDKFNNNTYFIPCLINTNIPNPPCYQNNNGYK